MAILDGPPERDDRDHVGGAEAVPLSDLDSRPVRVVFGPIPTVLAIADATCGGGGDVPRRWVQRARAALRPRDVRALRPVLERPDGFVPDSLLAMPGPGESDPLRALRRVAKVAAKRLLDELGADGGPGKEGPWADVAEEPERWAIRYAGALYRIWTAVERDVRGATALVDREVERVGAAAARGALAPLLADLHPDCAVEGDCWLLRAPRSRRLRIGERGLILVPKLTGPYAGLVRCYDGDELTHIAYPLPCAHRVGGEPKPQPSSLEALLGAALARPPPARPAAPDRPDRNRAHRRGRDRHPPRRPARGGGPGRPRAPRLPRLRPPHRPRLGAALPLRERLRGRPGPGFGPLDAAAPAFPSFRKIPEEFRG